MRDQKMHTRSPASVVFAYFGALTAAFAVIGFGLTAVVKASARLSGASPREKTVLELQVESAREIRRALAIPVSIPPLPPITARPARDSREIAAMQRGHSARPVLSPEARDAMAMGQNEASVPAQASSQPYTVRDRHSATW
jgi:hypothetical protein